MANGPAYLEAFKAYTRVQYGDEEQTAEALADLSKESDRGAVILAATGLEDMLENTIGVRMTALQTDAAARTGMFGATGICGTFAAKILMAYALGIIDKDIRKTLDLVREIRYGCAHGRLPLSFDREELSTICKVVIGAEFLAQLKDQEPNTIRAAFIISTANLGYSIALGRRVGPEEGFRMASAGVGRGERS